MGFLLFSSLGFLCARVCKATQHGRTAPRLACISFLLLRRVGPPIPPPPFWPFPPSVNVRRGVQMGRYICYTIDWLRYAITCLIMVYIWFCLSLWRVGVMRINLFDAVFPCFCFGYGTVLLCYGFLYVFLVYPSLCQFYSWYAVH